MLFCIRSIALLTLAPGLGPTLHSEGPLADGDKHVIWQALEPLSMNSPCVLSTSCVSPSQLLKQICHRPSRLFFYFVSHRQHNSLVQHPGSTMSAHTSSRVSDCTGTCQTPPQLELYQTIIFATPVVFACLLLVLFCLLYIRKHRGSINASQAQAQLASRDFPSPVYEQGLSKSFRQKLPTVPFDASREDNQCAVCLGEYQLNEKLQELPVCKHVFHVSCIDEWLAKNVTCPICRTSLSQDEQSSLLRRPEENRRWEERVLSEVQDGSIRVRLDALIGDEGVGSSGSMVGIPESFHYIGEHALNVERS